MTFSPFRDYEIPMPENLVGAIDSIKDVAGTINRFMDIRIDFLNLIVEQKPQLKVFIKGWLRRMESLESNALGDVS